MNERAFQAAGLDARAGEPLSAQTTFRLGGPCRFMVRCASGEDVQRAVSLLARAGDRWLLIGGGSNLLVADAGVDRAVVRYAGSPLPATHEGSRVEAEGGAALDDLAAWTVEQGLEGLEFLSGIPGTVGGAIAGNAGAFGRSVAESLDSVLLLSPKAEARRALGRDLGFAYRHSRLHETGEVVLSARFALRPGDASALRAERERLLAFRRERHPDWRTQPTAGSYFRNIEPTSRAGPRQAAGWFLEQAGAKSMRVGGARVFEHHANIIIAESGCAARDVLGLASRMADAVEERFGFRLRPEVRFVE